jgi:hypothetical protein
MSRAMAQHLQRNKQIIINMFTDFHPDDDIRFDRDTRSMRIFGSIADNKEIYNDILINDLIVPFPHNTPTNKSPLNKNGNDYVSRNQYITMKKYLSYAPLFPIIGLDIDMYELKGELTSKHGASMSSYLPSKFKLNMSDADTINLLYLIFQCAQDNPNTIFIIRTENNGVNAKRILEELDKIDLEEVLDKKCGDFLFTINKGEMPTYSTVIRSGKNVLFFLEKQKKDDSEFDTATGIYHEGFIMVQKCFMARTYWDKIPCLVNENIITIGKCLLTDDFSYLPNSNFFIMIDFYDTSIGANYLTIGDTHTKIELIWKYIYQNMIWYIQEYLSSKRGVDRTDIVCPTSGYMIMIDMVTPEIIYTFSALNYAIGIRSDSIMEMIKQYGSKLITGGGEEIQKLFHYVPSLNLAIGKKYGIPSLFIKGGTRRKKVRRNRTRRQTRRKLHHKK